MFLGIVAMARRLGVAVQTLRRWDREGRLTPNHRTEGGHRRYADPNHPRAGGENRLTVCYARVSTAEQKDDLSRQAFRLSAHAEAQGWRFETIRDVGSGMNCKKRGLLTLLRGIVSGEVNRLVLTHKDRLLRFGADLIFTLCAMRNVEIVILDQSGERSREMELASDVLEILTVFSSRLYGERSRKTRASRKIAIEPSAVCK